jgi:hypothetical protein
MAALMAATIFTFGLPAFTLGTAASLDHAASHEVTMTEELVIRYDGARFEVVSRRVMPVEFHAEEVMGTEFRFTLESWTGEVLHIGEFENPLERTVDRIGEDGLFISETISVPEATFTVQVPYFDQSAKLRVISSRQQELVSLETFLAAGESNSVPQYTTQTVINNGPSANRIDLVFLGDGYRSRDMSKFDQDIRNAADYLFKTTPFSEYKTYFNVHKVNVISKDAGIDRPSKGISKDTALDMTFDYYGVSEAVYTPLGSEYKVYQAAALVPQADFVVVLCNDRDFGGSSGPFKNIPVVTTNPLSLDLLVHELGHTLAFLADESDGSGQPPSREPSKVNVTMAKNIDGLKTAGKWDHWVTTGQPMPTPPELTGVGLFEGANGVSAGLYRPSNNCKMRSYNKPFCKVCSEQIIRRIYYMIRPIDSATPQVGAAKVQDTANGVINFSVSPMKPATHALTITWYVNGVAQEAQTTTFSLTTSSFAPGEHVITVEVKDTTPSVRRDPYNLLSKTQSWTVKI